MENNKYYTPEISEFHVGFEFEEIEMCSLDGGPRQIQWNKKILTSLGNSQFNWHVSSYPDELRVKYLDQEDIESLGYKKEKSEWHPFWNNFWKEYEWGVIKIRIKNEKRTSLSINCISKDNSSRVLFSGTIKNISILKQVLKMIGVE